MVEGDAKNLDLPTQLWNARLNGDNEEVKVVTQKMFEQVQDKLVDAFFEDNPLTFPKQDDYVEGVFKFLHPGLMDYPEKSTDCYHTIAKKGNNLSQGSDFTQVVTNQLFDDLEASNRMNNRDI